MKIEHTSNPLATKVHLDDNDRQLLKLKIHIEQLQESLYGVNYALASTNPPDIQQALRVSMPERFDGHPLTERVELLFNEYVESLLDMHAGDCTCFAVSCTKCHAEDLLGINTISGLGKHPAHKLLSAFSYQEDGVWKERTLNEALEQLYLFKPEKTHTDEAWVKAGGFEKHVDRWIAEAKHAHEWLLNYRATHFPESSV